MADGNEKAEESTPSLLLISGKHRTAFLSVSNELKLSSFLFGLLVA